MALGLTDPSGLTWAVYGYNLGVIADRVAIKKALLWIYTATGAGFTLLMAFGALAGSWEWAWMLGCFFIANVAVAREPS